LERVDGSSWTTEFGEEMGSEETGEAERGRDEDDLEGGCWADEEVLGVLLEKGNDGRQ
jgi:hypothetical protein